MAAMAVVNVVMTGVMIANLLGASRKMLRRSVIPMASSRAHSLTTAIVTPKTAHRVPAVVTMAETRDKI
jgi:hypothetical protein